MSGSDSEKDDMRLVPTLSLVVLKLSRTSFAIPDSFQWRLRFQGISPFRTTNSISSKHGLTRATSPEPRHRTRGLALIKEARTAKQKPLLLTRRVYFSVDFFLTSKRKYPVASIIKRVNVMCFDYHGGWDTLATGTHAWLRVLTALVETASFQLLYY